MNRIAGLKKRAKCAHEPTIRVLSAGIERQVCESCGHVRFEFVDRDHTEIERDVFARVVDEFAELGQHRSRESKRVGVGV